MRVRYQRGRHTHSDEPTRCIGNQLLTELDYLERVGHSGCVCWLYGRPSVWARTRGPRPRTVNHPGRSRLDETARSSIARDDDATQGTQADNNRPRAGGKMTPVDAGNAASGRASTFEPRVSCCSMPKAARRASGTGGDLKPRGLAGNAVSAAPYRAPRTSARHTRDADGRPRSPYPGFRGVQRHRSDRALRNMQRERGRAKHHAANERSPDDSQLPHEIFPSHFNMARSSR
jgi:hypothetical protein